MVGDAFAESTQVAEVWGILAGADINVTMSTMPSRIYGGRGTLNV